MSDQFLGEIRVVAFSYAPTGWALCNGQSLAISSNQALFAILGTTYGGDGIRTFNLPNLSGRVAVHPGNGIGLGGLAGEATHTLTTQEMPPHVHLQIAGGAATVNTAANNLPAQTADNFYAAVSNATMNSAAIQASGGSQPHQNMPPFLTLNYIIALAGLFPSRS